MAKVQQAEFLLALREHKGIVMRAAAAVGITRDAVHAWRKRDVAFDEACQAVIVKFFDERKGRGAKPKKIFASHESFVNGAEPADSPQAAKVEPAALGALDPFALSVDDIAEKLQDMQAVVRDAVQLMLADMLAAWQIHLTPVLSDRRTMQGLKALAQRTQGSTRGPLTDVLEAVCEQCQTPSAG